MTNPNILGIELLPNQQFIFDVEEPNCKIDDTQYCQLVSSGDNIQIQEKLKFNTSCFGTLICNEIIGEDLVINGIFYGSQGWLEAGNNWTISSGVACYTVKNGAGVLYQTIGGLVEGNTYRLKFTISSYESGTLTPFLWSTPGSAVSANGDYTQYITIAPGHANEFLDFVDSAIWGGCIDNISLQEVTCWDGQGAGANWLLSNDGTDSFMCHTVGSVTPIQTFNNITIDCGAGTFELILTITGRTDGSITPSINANAFPTISSNGTHSVYLNAGGGAPLLITPTTDFNGCITDIELRAMCEYPQLALFDLDDNLVCYLSGDGGVDIYITQDRITWSFQLNLTECIIAYGCYKFKISDPCNDCFVSENDVLNPEFETDLSNWTAGGAWAWDAGTAHYTFPGSGAGATILQGLTSAQRCVRIIVNSITAGGSLIAVIHNGGNVTDQVTILSAGIYNLCGYVDQISLIATPSAGKEYVVKSVHAMPVDSCNGCAKYCYQVESNCLNYRLSHSCTKYISASCNENSLGFVFVNGVQPVFALLARLRTVTMNPVHPKKRRVELDSGGSKKLVYSESEKTWQLRFDYCDHITHDTISAMLECDNIEINHGLIAGNPIAYNLLKDYVSVTDDYVPEWDSKGQRNLAQSQVEVREVQSTIFNQNLE